MRNKLKASISLLLILILTIAFSIPALAETSVIPTGENKDPIKGETCTGFKIDEVENIKSDEPYTLINGDYRFIITKTTIDDVEYFDWTSNVPVTHIFVKGGNNGNLYTIDASEMSGTALHAPVNSSGKYAGLSHITFYVCDDDDENAPSIDIEKLVSVDGGKTWHDADSPTGPTGSYPGTAKFKVIVTNTGNDALTDIKVTDTDFTFTGVASSLAAGATSTSAVMSVNTILGQHTNTAAVNAEYDGDAITPDSDMAHYITYSTPHASIDIEKLVSVDGGNNWHDADSPTGPTGSYPGTAKFKVIVTNTGNVSLTEIKVTDTDFTFTGVASDLAAGAVSTSDVKTVDTILGQHTNTATVNAEYDGDAITPDSDMAHYITYSTPHAAIDIEKYVWNGEDFEDADTATGPHLMSDPVYKFVVKNTGNVTLDDIEFWDVPTISYFFDDQTLMDPFMLPETLAPNAGFTAYGTMDWEYGQQSDTAYVTGTPPEGMDVTDSDLAHYYGHEMTPRATIDIEKLVSVDGGNTWHDADSPTGPTIRLPGTVRFKVIVTNTGTVDLTNIVVTDPDFEFTGVVTSLDAGDHDESNITAVPAERYQHTNTATVNAKYDGQPITPDSDKAHYYGDYERRDNDSPDISIKKYVSADGGTTWDDAENASGPRATYPGTVQFKVVIKNTGDYRLTDIEVTDTDFEFTGVASTLDEGDSDTSDIITVATIDGQHSNTAEVEGFYGSQKVTDSDKAHYYTNDDDNLNENGKISIHKFLDDNRNGIQDNQDFHMQNVTFELYAANKTEMLGSQITDNEGNLTFTNLEFGTYYLEEKSEYDITTKGFDADGFMKITVNSNETVTIIVGNENENVIASDNVVIVEEPVPLALPTTGEQPPTSMYILGGLIMLAGMFLKRFK